MLTNNPLGVAPILPFFVERFRSIAIPLQTITVLMTAVLIGTFGIRAYDAYERHLKAQPVPAIVDITKDLFDAVLNVRLERGILNTALVTKAVIDANTEGQITSLRTQSGKSLDSALAKLSRISLPDIASALIAIRTTRESFLKVRAQADAAVRRPYDQRSQNLSSTWIEANTKLVEAIDALSTQLASDVGRDNPFLALMMQIKEIAWSARSDAGLDRLLIAEAIASGTKLTGAQRRDFAALTARIDGAWKIIQHMTSQASTPPQLREAIETANTLYFAELRPRRNAIVDDLAEGTPVSVSPQEWVDLAAPGQQSIFSVADTALSIAGSDAANELAEARTDLYLEAGLIVIFLGIGGLKSAYVFKGLARPITRITTAVHAVANGDLNCDIPYERRNDEIGLLARALRVFRDHAIEMNQLHKTIEEANDRLSTAQAELEARVEERTHDLKKQILAREKVERFLRESELRYRSLTQNIPGMVFQKIRYPDGQIEYPFMSDGIREMLGLEPEAVVANPLLMGQTIHADDRERYQSAFETSADSLTNIDIEFRHRRVDDAIRWTRILSRPRAQQNNTVIWDCLGFDTTDMHLATERNAQLQSRLRQVEKMDALGTLAGGVAHELNNLLQPIIMGADIILLDLPASSPHTPQLLRIVNAGTKAADIVRRILAFGRADEPTYDLVAVGPVVRDALAFVRTLLPSSITLHTDIDDFAGTVRGDRTQLTQVLMNLATNARDAIGGRAGTMRVHLSKSTFEKDEIHCQAGAIQRGNYAVLAVEDTGAGMDEATTKKIFEPFFTTKGVGKGTGLGLSLTHGIVMDHGGAIGVESALGRGTKFSIYLPIEEIGATLAAAC